MLCKVGNSDPSISCIKYFLSFLVLMLTLISSVAFAGTISITSVSVNPAPGPITLNNDGWAQFSMTVCYSASGFGPNDTVDICAQLCKPGSCGSGSAVIGTVKYPNGSGCVTKTVWLGGIHMRGYCGDAFINVNILCYESVPQCHTDSRIINGYTVTCECNYSLTVSVSGSGSVSCSPNKSSYGCNETVTLTASPSQGWRFDHWGGDLSGTANPTTITMNGNKAVVAYFVQEPCTYNPVISLHPCSPYSVMGWTGTQFMFVFTVENQGTVTDRIKLTAVTKHPGLEVALAPATLDLDPGSTSQVELYVKVKQAEYNEIAVKASSTSDPSKFSEIKVSYVEPHWSNPLFYKFCFSPPRDGSSLTFIAPDYVKISNLVNDSVNVVFDPSPDEAHLRNFRLIIQCKREQEIIKELEILIGVPDCEIVATKFKVDVDGYSFDNRPWFTIPLFNIDVLGYCYGFAETSILYYNWWYEERPSSTPPHYARTYELPSTRDVWFWIVCHFWNQLTNADVWKSISFADERQEVEELRRELQSGQPMILSLRFKGALLKTGHAVVVYKLIQLGNELYFVTYDNNVHYTESFGPETFPCLKYNLSTGEFDFPGYGKLLTFTATKPNPSTWIILRFECPLTVKITDQYGRTISDAGINEIPGAEFLVLGEAKAFYLPLTLEYHVEIQGTKNGTFNFTIGLPYGETFSILGSTDIPITENTRAYMNITPGVADYTISIDFNGDGLVDEERKPDFKMTTEIRGNTPAGRDVEVPFLDQGVNIVFSNVYMAGHTTVTTTDEFPFDLPIGIKFLKFYRFDTTAQYTGPITIQIKYDDTGLSPDEENKLRLFKIAPKEAPNDITANLDTQNNAITGTTDTLSYFALGYQLWVPPTGTVIKHGPNPVPAEGCIFWLALPADTASATLKIYAVDGALLISIPLDRTADHYPPVGRWVPQDSNGRLLGTGLYLYLVEIHHADGRVTYSPLQKMVIKR